MFLMHEPYLPEAVGGGLFSVDTLIRELSVLGHAGEVVALRPVGPLTRRLPRPLAAPLIRWGTRLASRSDSVNGYLTYRAGNALGMAGVVHRRLQQFRPDVVAIQGIFKRRLIRMVERTSAARIVIRAVTHYCALELEREMARSPRFAERIRGGEIKIISNSRFLAEMMADRLAVTSSVRYPPISLAGRPQSTAGPDGPVLFVNPVPDKGVEIALAVARLLPQRQFLFQEAWTLGDRAWRELQARVADLPNVQLRRRSLDFPGVLSQSAVLLMPSQWDEAFGRVAVEATAHGVPVVASRVGGIPEALGESGTLLERSSAPREWADALEALLADPLAYERAVAAALANATRAEFDPATIARGFLADFGYPQEGTP